MRPKSIVISLFFLITLATSYAQDDNRLMVVNVKDLPGNSNRLDPDVFKENSFESMNTNNLKQVTDVVPKVLHSFSTNYKTASDVQWFSYDKKGKFFLVKFYNSEKECRALYNKNGHILYSIGQQSEKDLPPSTRKIIRSMYFDHKIVSVIEVISYCAKAWTVGLKSADEIVTIRIEDDIIEELTRDQVSKERFRNKKQLSALAAN